MSPSIRHRAVLAVWLVPSAAFASRRRVSQRSRVLHDGGRALAPEVGSAEGRRRYTLSWAFTSTTILFGDGKRADLERHTVFVGTEGADPEVAQPSASAREASWRARSLRITPARISGRESDGYFGVAKSSWTRRGGFPSCRSAARSPGSRVATRGPGVNRRQSFTAFDIRAAPQRRQDGQPAGDLRHGPGLRRSIFYRYAGESVTGTDLYKYQVGGASLALPSRILDAFVEGIALGRAAASRRTWAPRSVFLAPVPVRVSGSRIPLRLVVAPSQLLVSPLRLWRARFAPFELETKFHRSR